MTLGQRVLKCPGAGGNRGCGTLGHVACCLRSWMLRAGRTKGLRVDRAPCRRDCSQGQLLERPGVQGDSEAVRGQECGFCSGVHGQLQPLGRRQSMRSREPRHQSPSWPLARSWVEVGVPLRHPCPSRNGSLTSWMFTWICPVPSLSRDLKAPAGEGRRGRGCFLDTNCPNTWEAGDSHGWHGLKFLLCAKGSPHKPAWPSCVPVSFL